MKVLGAYGQGLFRPGPERVVLPQRAELVLVEPGEPGERLVPHLMDLLLEAGASAVRVGSICVVPMFTLSSHLNERGTGIV